MEGKKFEIKRVDIGHLEIKNGKVDITDPSYDKDVWCRMNDVEVSPGNYHCYIWHGDEPDFGHRIWVIGIEKVRAYLADEDWEEIGEIGVDAGIAGFIIDKPDYSQEEWSKLCDEMFSKPCPMKPIQKYDAYLTKTGFWSESGIGDGAYGVYAKKKSDGKIAALEIRF